MLTVLNTLTTEQLQVCTGASKSNAELFLPYIKEVCKSFGINTPKRLAAFLSQVGHESAGFSQLEENLNYSAEGLANVWPKRYAKRLQNGVYAKNKVGRYLPSTLALKIARRPVLIANNCYANRMGNSDEASGEGWKFRGRGLKQLTGKSNYARLTLETGIDFISNPDLLLQPAYGVISACWFWKVNNLEYFADKEDIEGLTEKINGGLIGIQQRKALYSKAIEILS
jgi:putative chitinase